MRGGITVAALVATLALLPSAVVDTAGFAGRDGLIQPVAAPTTRAFGGVRTSSVYITMSDGVRLAADVHLPRGLRAGERTATILHMRRYYRSVQLRGFYRLFLRGTYPLTEHDLRERMVKAGYSWVDVDVRGSGASFGRSEYPFSAREVEDGREVMDWIVTQPWSAGVIGTTGSSYNGVLATLLIRHEHPALGAVAPRFTGWDGYADLYVPGGLRATSMIQGMDDLLGALDEGRLGETLGRAGGPISGPRPVSGTDLGPALAERRFNGRLADLLAPVVHRDDPSAHPSGVTPDDVSPHAVVGAQARVPVYAYAGYFDGALARGQARQFLASPARGSRLRLGPWFHNGEFNSSPYAASRENTFDHTAEVVRFFDAHLRGMHPGFADEPPVHYYTMGAEQWRTAPTWPPPGTAWTTLHLGVERTLARVAAGDALDDRYEVDTALTTGKSRWGIVATSGATREHGDRRAVASRMLGYTSPPVEAPLEITGHPRVHLRLSANAADGAVFVYLEDVAPDGQVRYVTEGLLRLLHRRLAAPVTDETLIPERTYRRADATPLVPGEAVDVVLDLLPTSYVVPAGHAIRLSIAGADAGNFEVPLPDSGPLVYAVEGGRVELPGPR